MENEDGEGGCSTAVVENYSQQSDSVEGVDFISSLPDVILQEILSSFQTNFVVRTSVLSKRWKHVWSGTPTLSYKFNRMDAGPIDRILTRYNAPKITSFLLYSISLDTGPYIERWIKLAKSRDVEYLSLDLSFFEFEKYKLPDFFYVMSSLKRLEMEFSFRCDLIPGCKVSWTSLKKLHLRKCNLPDESMANILSGCPMLEILKLDTYAHLRHLDLRKSLRLWKLEINHGGWDALGPLEIVAPHIRYLDLYTAMDPWTLVDVSSLTEANIKIWFKWNGLKPEDIHHKMLNILNKLHNVKKLTTQALFLQVLSLSLYIGFSFPTFKVEALELETKIVVSVMPSIEILLQNSPKLKKLTIRIMGMEGSILSDENVVNFLLGWEGLNPYQDWCDFWKFKYGNLPTLDKSGLALFMDFVVRNTRTLETLVIVLENGCVDIPSVDELLRLAPGFSNSGVSIVLKKSP